MLARTGDRRAPYGTDLWQESSDRIKTQGDSGLLHSSGPARMRHSKCPPLGTNRSPQLFGEAMMAWKTLCILGIDNKWILKDPVGVECLQSAKAWGRMSLMFHVPIIQIQASSATTLNDRHLSITATVGVTMATASTHEAALSLPIPYPKASMEPHKEPL